MAKLNWSLKDEETLIAKGDDTGVEFVINSTSGGEDLPLMYALRVPGHGRHQVSESIVELMLDAQDIENRDEDPNNTFRDDFAGFAPNH